MTDGIGRIFGGNSFGVGGYVPQRKGEEAAQEAKEPVVQPERKEVNPDEIMNIMANQALAPVKPEEKGFKLSPEVEERIAGFTRNFEEAFEIAKNEVGDSDLALFILDNM